MKARYIAFHLPLRTIRHMNYPGLVLFGLLVLGLVLGLPGYLQLKKMTLAWQAQGQEILTMRLLTVLPLVWTMIAGLSLMALIRHSFGDLGTLLMTMHMPSGSRFRGLLGYGYWEALNLWILALVVTGLPVITVLGFNAGLAWVLLTLLWGLNAVWFLFFLFLFSIRYLFPNPKLFIFILLLAAAGVVLLVRGASGGSPAFRLSPVQIYLIDGVLFLLFLAVVGPLAKVLDRFYCKTYLFYQTRTPRMERRRFLGKLTSLLKRRRSPTFALLTRGLINRSRHWAGPARIALLVIIAFFFPVIITKLPFSNDPFALTMFLFAGVMFLVFDAEPSPIGSEGSRLAIYLTMPFKPAAIVDAKYRVFFVSFWLPGLAAGLILGKVIGLSWASLLPVFAMFTVWLLGIAGIIAYGSAWDADLDLVIGPGLVALAQEEVPLTAKRMALVTFAMLHTVMHGVIFWHTALAVSLPVLLIFNISLVMATRKFSRNYLRKIVR